MLPPVLKNLLFLKNVDCPWTVFMKIKDKKEINTDLKKNKGWRTELCFHKIYINVGHILDEPSFIMLCADTWLRNS